jgi:hypothetical protein
VTAELSPKQQERQERLDALTTETLEQLASDLARGHTDQFLTFMAFWARFRRYSARNTLLLMLQKPDALAIASYTKWQQLGRQVRKGATAAWVYAPVTKKVIEDGQEREKVVGFRLVPTFSDKDLEDIESNPLPSPVPELPDDAEPTYQRVKARLIDSGVKVIEKKLGRGVYGWCRAGTICIGTGYDSRNRLLTLLHETAHHFAHVGNTGEEKRSTQQEELEAECAASIVGKSLGVDSPFTVDYLLNYRISADDLRASLEAVAKICRQLFRLLEEETQPHGAAA